MYARRGGLLLVALFMALLGLSAWWGLQREAAVHHTAAFDTAVAWQPWGGPAWIPGARRTLSELTVPDRRKQLLQRLGNRYPLAATLWLEQARTAHARQESIATVKQLLDMALAVEPGTAENYWRAAMIAIQADDLAAAGDYLRRFVGLRPAAIDRAVLIARRWLDGPELLLATLAPDNTEALVYLLRYSASWQDWILAGNVWQRLPESAATDVSVINGYVDRLLSAGHGLHAASVWGRADPAFAAGAISNGDFADPLPERSLFDWRIRTPKGVMIERDAHEFYSATASLHVQFSGSHNVRLDSPEQFVAVQPGQTYTLSGRWRAQGLTTLALPYWVVTSHGPDDRTALAKIAAATRDAWPWQAFSATIAVPPTSEVIRIQLRRDPTNNFDRFIAGDVWVDDIRLRQVQSEAEASDEGR
jgi:hypothetical protein